MATGHQAQGAPPHGATSNRRAAAGASGRGATNTARKLMTEKSWFRPPPEIYPLLVPIAFACGLCGWMLVRKIATDPGITIDKERRSEGMSEELKKGSKYKLHGLRKWLHEHPPEIMPGLNKYFSGSKN